MAARRTIEKPPGDETPLSVASPGEHSASEEKPRESPPAEQPPEAAEAKLSKFEEYHILAPGKSLHCAAGLLKGGDEVTASGLGKARFDRLKEVGTVVAKKRRFK